MRGGERGGEGGGERGGTEVDKLTYADSRSANSFLFRQDGAWELCTASPIRRRKGREGGGNCWTEQQAV